MNNDEHYNNVVILNNYKSQCDHLTYEIDRNLTMIICAKCHIELNPFQILVKLCIQEITMRKQLNALRDKVLKLQIKIIEMK